MTKQSAQDIIIIGGGPAGLSLACSLSGLGLSITVLEQQPLTALQEPDYDGREIALTHFSKMVLEDMGVWEHLPPEVVSYVKEAKVLDGDAPYMLHFDYREVCDDTLGYMVANQHIRKALYAKAATLSDVTIMPEVRVAQVETSYPEATVTLEGGELLQAKLVVAADSRFSASRQQMGIAVDMHQFGRTAIVCRFDHELDHHYIAYECFRYGGTLAMLPLAGGKQSSAVITLSTEKVSTLLEQDEAAFGAEVQRQFGNRLGAMVQSSERYSYPLVTSYARQFVAPRYALLGDAAVGMHPVTAHGFNLGLKGQDILAGEIREALLKGTDIGAPETLKRYEVKHRRASRALYLATQAVVKLYTDERPLPKLVRKGVLRLGNYITPARHAIMHHLTETR